MTYSSIDNLIEARLKKIYSHSDAKLCLEGIMALIDQYKKEITPKPHIESISCERWRPNSAIDITGDNPRW